VNVSARKDSRSFAFGRVECISDLFSHLAGDARRVNLARQLSSGLPSFTEKGNSAVKFAAILP